MLKALLYGLCLSLHIGGFAYLDITQHGYEQYQDIWIQGRVVKKATHNHLDCNQRFQIIDTILSRYKRPFTMLDLGAAQGYYSLRAAEKYPQSVFVMMEGNNAHYPLIGKQLHSICIDNGLKNVILLQQPIKRIDLAALVECEHFDVVLALNIIHWFPHCWKDIATSILNLGYDVIIETPPPEEINESSHHRVRKAITDFLNHHEATLLANVPRHTSNHYLSRIYHIRGKRHHLKEKTWFYTSSALNQNPSAAILKKMRNSESHATYTIEVDYTQKNLIKKSLKTQQIRKTCWIPGINLITFIAYQGSYPLNSVLSLEMNRLANIASTDWAINNMICQGAQLQLIDIEDMEPAVHKQKGSPEKLMKSKQLLKKRNRKQIIEFFWNILYRTP